MIMIGDKKMFLGTIDLSLPENKDLAARIRLHARALGISFERALIEWNRILQIYERPTKMFGTLLKETKTTLRFIKKAIVVENKRLITTHCILVKNRDKGDPDIFVGVACQSPKDRYNRKIGQKLALTRALERSSFNKEERTEIWNQYLITFGC